MKQAIIVASGLADLVGHEFEYTAAVAKVLRNRGYSVSILGASGAAPEVAALEGFIPAFRPTTRLPGAKAPPWEFLRLVWIFLADLQRALTSLQLEDCELIFAHTITYPNFPGWVWFLHQFGKTLPKTVLLFRFSLALRHPSRFRVLRQLLMPPAYRVMFWIVQRSPRRPVVVVDSEDLREEYESFTRLPIKVVPIPLEVDGLEASLRAALEKRSDCSGRRLLYLGDVRWGKGFDLLPSLVQAFAGDSSGDTSITIHCGRPADRHGGSGIPEAYLRLQELSEVGAVELISSNLTRTDYFALLCNADIVLLPYRKEYYMAQTSNVLAEAFAAGKPVVVPKDTWMATQVSSTGAGTTFTSGNGESFLEATCEIVQHFPKYADAASRLREDWNAYHNVDRLVDKLESA